jgi:GDP-L-fucose synthase
MSLPDAQYERLLGSDESKSGRFEPPLVNIGCGEDVTIAELTQLVREVTGFTGDIRYDTSKPDGTPRKLLDVSILTRAGWRPRTPLAEGLREAYRAFLAAGA